MEHKEVPFVSVNKVFILFILLYLIKISKSLSQLVFHLLFNFDLFALQLSCKYILNVVMSFQRSLVVFRGKLEIWMLVNYAQKDLAIMFFFLFLNSIIEAIFFHALVLSRDILEVLIDLIDLKN